MLFSVLVLGLISWFLTGCSLCCGGHGEKATQATPPAPVTGAKPAATVTPGGERSEDFSLFDGKTLMGWAISDFAGSGEVKVEDGNLILGNGYMTGVTYTNTLPRMNYEATYEAMRVEGSDFFAGFTFPVGEHPCSFIVGGWGGGVVGLSSIDGEDAAHNETTQYLNFENGRWYAMRVRVTPNKIEAWIDQDKVVDQVTTGRRISIRVEMEPCVPLGFATWSTTGAIRKVRLKVL